MLWMLPARFQFKVTALVAIVASFSCFAETGERRDLNRNWREAVLLPDDVCS